MFSPDNDERCSVFMTPSSDGKPLYPRLLTSPSSPLCLTYLSPRESPRPPRHPHPASACTEFKDIVGDLYSEGVPHIGTKILSYLSIKELLM